MKFQTKALLSAIDREIARRDKATEKKNAEERERHAKARREWLDSGAPEQLREAFKRLGEKLRRGGVVTTDDVRPFAPRWSGEEKITLAPDAKPTVHTTNYGNLLNLREFLKTVSDPEVSSAGLRDVGFRDLAGLSREASRADS